MKYLVKCNHCGQIYKCDAKASVKGVQYITDYKDNVTKHCVVCGKDGEPTVIRTQDWIADMVFKIKGS